MEDDCALLHLPSEISYQIIERLDRRDRFGGFGCASKVCNALAFSSPLPELLLFSDGDCANEVKQAIIQIENDFHSFGVYSLEMRDGVTARFDEAFALSSFYRFFLF